MRPKKIVNRENVAEHLVRKQLALIGKTFEEAEQNPNWYKEWEMEEEKFKQFEKESIEVLKKVFKCNTNKARKTFDWFNLMWGLKIKENAKH